MKNIMVFSVLLCCLSMIAHSAELNKTQVEFMSSYKLGMESGNIEEFTGNLSSDIKIFPEYDYSFLGYESAVDYFRSIVGLYDITHYEREVTEVINLGGRSLVIGTFEMDFVKRENLKTYSLPGTWFDVWDTSGPTSKIITLSWNYDKPIDGIENVFRSKTNSGVHYAFQPTAPLTFEQPDKTWGDASVAELNQVSKDLFVFREQVKVLMNAKDPRNLSMQYSTDSKYAQHNVPIIEGRNSTEDFFKSYTKGWVDFEYIDVNAHDFYVHENYILAHTSYNLRWRNDNYSGLVFGKSIRLFEYSTEGMLLAHRTISLHD